MINDDYIGMAFPDDKQYSGLLDDGDALEGIGAEALEELTDNKGEDE